MPEMTVAASLDNLHSIREFLSHSLDEQEVPASQQTELVLAVDEAVTNIITHGYQSSEGSISLTIHCQSGNTIITITDHAPAFHPAADHQPDLTSPPEQRESPGGFGLYLIEKMVDKAEYKNLPDGRNQLTLIKHAQAAC